MPVCMLTWLPDCLSGLDRILAQVTDPSFYPSYHKYSSYITDSVPFFEENPFGDIID